MTPKMPLPGCFKAAKPPASGRPRIREMAALGEKAAQGRKNNGKLILGQGPSGRLTHGFNGVFHVRGLVEGQGRPK